MERETSAIKHAEEIEKIQGGQNKFIFYCRKLRNYFVRLINKKLPGGEKRQVLQNVSFGIKKNEIFGLIGPNGAGKSTLINIITSQLNEYSGEFIVDNFLQRSEISRITSLRKKGF